jgi:hypothetical protein
MTGKQIAEHHGHAAVLDVLRVATGRRRELEAERVAAAQREEVGRLIARQAFRAAAPLLARILRDSPADPGLLAWQAEVAAGQAGAEAAADANTVALLAELEAEDRGGGSVGQSKSQKKKEKQRRRKEAAAAAAAEAAAVDNVPEPGLQVEMAADVDEGEDPAMEVLRHPRHDGPVERFGAALLDGDAAAVSRLLAAGEVDPNAEIADIFDSADTPLCATAARGHLEVARLLLLATPGADPNLVTGKGDTPLMNAAGNGHLVVLRLLLARGAALDTAHLAHGTTAFHYACFYNQPDCAEALARAGCDPRIKDDDGEMARPHGGAARPHGGGGATAGAGSRAAGRGCGGGVRPPRRDYNARAWPWTA